MLHKTLVYKKFQRRSCHFFLKTTQSLRPGGVTLCSFYEKMTRPMLKFFVHDGFMQHAKCTRATLVLYFHFKHDFDGILSILEGKFMKILMTWHWRTVTRMFENIVRIYKRVTYPLSVYYLWWNKAPKTNLW